MPCGLARGDGLRRDLSLPGDAPCRLLSGRVEFLLLPARLQRRRPLPALCGQPGRDPDPLYQAAIKAFGSVSPPPDSPALDRDVLACSLLLFLYLRRRTLPWFAFFPSCLLLVFGAAWTDQATSLGLVRLSAVVAGLGALVALDLRSLRADLCASALLVVALAVTQRGAALRGRGCDHRRPTRGAGRSGAGHGSGRRR